MNHTRTTPVPNVLFDFYLKELSCAELKVLLVIIRKTLGWMDKHALRGRKEVDWISNSQLQSMSGCSRRAITTATENLIKRKLIKVLHGDGTLLDNPQKRKGKQRLFYKLTQGISAPVESLLKRNEDSLNSNSPSAMIAEDLSKNITALAQKMRITKETLQN